MPNKIYPTTVSLELEGGEILSKNNITVNLSPENRETITFKVKAGHDQKIKFRFSAKNDQFQDILLEKRRIDTGTTKEVTSTSGKITDTAREKIYLSSDLVPSQGILTVNLSATLANFLSNNLKLLKSYEYECTEQIVSKLFPNALILNNTSLNTLFSETEKQKSKTIINQGLAKIYSQQNHDGSWGYFSGNSHQVYLTAYVLIALEEMNLSGSEIDKDIITKSRKFLQQNRNTEDLITQGLTRWALSYSDWDESNREYALRILKEDAMKPKSEQLPFFARTYWALFAKDLKILEPILASVIQSDRGLFFE